MKDKEFDRWLEAARERWRPFNEWKGKIDERILRLDVRTKLGAREVGLPQGTGRDASLARRGHRQARRGGGARSARRPRRERQRRQATQARKRAIAGQVNKQ